MNIELLIFFLLLLLIGTILAAQVQKYLHQHRSITMSQKVVSMKEAQRALKRMDEVYALPFNNMDSYDQKYVKVTKKAQCDFNHDRIFHGKLVIHTLQGQVNIEDVYLFQPRIYDADNHLLGPIYEKNGHLGDKYLYQKKIDSSSLWAYVPKKEVVSGLDYDYVGKSRHCSNNDINKFIDIIIPQDKDGNFIPIDLNNARDLEELNAYVAFFTKRHVDPLTYFKDRISYASEGLEKYYQYQSLLQIKNIGVTPNIRVKESRIAKTSIKRFYHEYYQWQPKKFAGSILQLADEAAIPIANIYN